MCKSESKRVIDSAVRSWRAEIESGQDPVISAASVPYIPAAVSSEQQQSMSLSHPRFRTPFDLRQLPMQRRTKSQRPRRPRQRKAAASTSTQKSVPQDARRQRAKRVAARQVRGPRAPSQAPRFSKKPTRRIRADPIAVKKLTRERWAAIAAETQQIVMGDGKYVEERHVSTDASACAHHDLGAAPDSTGLSPPVRVAHDIFAQVQLSKQGTIFFPHYSAFLAHWASTPRRSLPSGSHTILEFAQCTPVTATHRLVSSTPSSSPRPPSSSIGILSFASPKKPGGGYLHGGDEQEETFARYSSLVESLSSPAAKQFYEEHRHYRAEDGSGLHNHSMVYSPGVVVFRAHRDDTALTSPLPPDELDGAFIAPYTVDVVSAVPVNAAAVRAKHIILPSERQFFENGIRSAMKERMARALRVFEDKGDRAIVLGAFGCMSSENNVETVAAIWAELLVCGEEGEKAGPYKDVFDKVVFAVTGKQFKKFKAEFEMRIFEAEVARAALSD